MLLYACYCTYVTVRLLLRVCYCTFANVRMYCTFVTARMLLYICYCMYVTVRLLLHVCYCTFVNVRMYCTFVTARMLLYACYCTILLYICYCMYVTVRLLLHLCYCTFVNVRMLLYACYCTYVTVRLLMYVYYCTDASSCYSNNNAFYPITPKQKVIRQVFTCCQLVPSTPHRMTAIKTFPNDRHYNKTVRDRQHHERETWTGNVAKQLRHFTQLCYNAEEKISRVKN